LPSFISEVKYSIRRQHAQFPPLYVDSKEASGPPGAQRTAVTHDSQGGDNKNCGEPHTTSASDPALVDENTGLKAIEA
jgi:hypothetical protein